MEWGLLSALTGNRSYAARARGAAELIYRRRSALGLVGSSLHTTTTAWVSHDATIGPLGDSYYEYLLKVGGEVGGVRGVGYRACWRKGKGPVP